MKTDGLSFTDLCSRPVLAPSTACVPQKRGQSTELPSLLSESLRHPHTTYASMRLTDRDREIVDLVYHAGALRDDQIQIALFTPGGASRCQRRLTLLTHYRYLDRLPRASVNEPAVYVLSRRSVAGNRLVREHLPSTAFHGQLSRLGPLAHLLGVNDVRVRVGRACRDLGWSLPRWDTPEALRSPLAATHLIPDAYWQVQRRVEGQPRTAAFFLEFERVAKSSRVLESKLRRYSDFYYSGQYARALGTRALRLLVVFASDAGHLGAHRAKSGVDLAKRIGITFARFADLEELKGQSPLGCFTAPIWLTPGQMETVSLFERTDPSE